MRHALAVALSLAALVACSSSSEDDAAEEACPIVGTYNIQGELVSGNCGPGSAATYTISADGPGFLVEVPGLQGGCPLEQIGTCKVQGKCDITGADALDPSNAVGGVSFAWTFRKEGFEGTNTLSLPPAKSLPEGCSGQYKITGSRL
jgi:hypothetical protein